MPHAHAFRHPPALLLAAFAVLCLVALAGCGTSATAARPTSLPACLTSPPATLGTSSTASIAVMDSLPQLKRKSTVILVSTVQRTCATQVAPGSIYTDATLKVDHLIYDPAHRVTGTTVVVRVLGWQIGNSGEMVEDQPIFHAGDQYVLFLTPTLYGTSPYGRYSPVDGIDGALPVQNGMVQTFTASAPVPESDFITQIEQA